MTDPTNPAPADPAAPAAVTLTPTPLRAFWPCLVGAIAVVALLFAMPWSVIFSGVFTALAVVFGWAMDSIFAAGKVGVGVALVTLIAGFCVIIKAVQRQQVVQNAQWLFIAIALSLIWLFFAGVVHLHRNAVYTGTSVNAVIQAFEAPNSPEMALVHQMSEQDRRLVARLSMKDPDYAKKPLVNTPAGAAAENLTIEQFDVWDLVVREFYDKADHGHLWGNSLCRRLEKAYLSAPLEIQKQYRVTIAGETLSPGAASSNLCLPRRTTPVEVRWAALRATP